MHFSYLAFLEAFILSSALSMDAFVSGFAYGSNKIKIPISSVIIINIVCSSILGLSLLIGNLVRNNIPIWLTSIICFAILFFLGIAKLLDSITKSFIKKHTKVNKKIKFSAFNFKFILHLYAEPEKADLDCSKIISSTEAVLLAIALSLDGLAIGFGAGLSDINCLLVILCALFTDSSCIILGTYVGNKVARKTCFNLSWLSGVLLIVLAFLRLN